MDHGAALRTDVTSQPETAGAANDPSMRLEPLAVPFGRMGSILRRHLWIIILTFLAGVGGMAVIVHGMPKLYTAEASIIIEPQRTQVSDLQAISPSVEDVASLVRTQIDILRSPALAIGVVKALHLTTNPEFAPKPGGWKDAVRNWLRKAGLVAPPGPPASADDIMMTAAAIFGGKISFGNEVHSSLLRVDVTTGNPSVSAQIANEIVKQYLDFKIHEKFAAMQRAHDWLQGQVAALAQQGADRGHGGRAIPPATRTWRGSA